MRKFDVFSDRLSITFNCNENKRELLTLISKHLIGNINLIENHPSTVVAELDPKFLFHFLWRNHIV